MFRAKITRKGGRPTFEVATSEVATSEVATSEVATSEVAGFSFSFQNLFFLVGGWVPPGTCGGGDPPPLA